jgi:hypothetical protein
MFDLKNLINKYLKNYKIIPLKFDVLKENVE